MNNTEPETSFKHKAVQEIRNICMAENGDSASEKVCEIQQEFLQGIEGAKEFKSSVTFYGSALIGDTSPSYEQARHLAYRISKELNYAVISGGGPGIMEAANRGAFEAEGKSVGFTIRLPREQNTNKYVTEEIPFNFFFARQTAMSYSTEVCIFCPGGYGTFDELFEILTLQQTKKIGRFPIILLGVEFWTPLIKVIQEVLLEKYGTIQDKDLNYFTISDDEEEILEIIKVGKIREGADVLQ